MQESQSQSANAKNLLGAPQEDDWKLNPGAHAERLGDGAEALGKVLEHSAIEEIIRRYDRLDKGALSHQKIYKNYGRAEIYLASAAAILGALVLSMAESEGLSPLFQFTRNSLLAIQILCAAGVGAVNYVIRQKDPFIKWQKMRSRAEAARIELFETVCGLTDRKWGESKDGGSMPLLSLQLEYFIRYQLMVQLFFFEERGKQHQAAASRYTSTGAIITFFAALAAGAVGYLNQLADMVSIASLAALVAPVLLTAKTGLSHLNQDERNAARYSITFSHLDRLRGRLSDVREAAVINDATAVQDFIRDVNAVISVEHSQWKTQQSEAVQNEPESEAGN